MFRSKPRSSLLALAAAVACGGRAFGDTYKSPSTAGGSYNWTNPAAWQDTTTPANTGVYYPGFTGNTYTNDPANIDNGTTVTIDGTQGIGRISPANGISPLQVGDATGQTGTLNITGGLLATTSDFRIGGAGGNASTASATGVVTQGGGTVYLNGGNFNLGYSGNGTYNLNGGLIEMQSGTLFVVGNNNNYLAAGNTGPAQMNQTGGTVYVQIASATGGVQLGRNATGAGTYSLSGGNLLVSNILFGSSNNTTSNPQVFNLSGGGRVVANNITVLSTTTTNSFNMTGGRLTANSIGISVTNNGGIADPATATFPTSATSGADPNAFLNNVNPIGTMAFTGANGYTQTATGTLRIDLAGASSFDQITLVSGTAAIGGNIAVDTLNGFDPSVGTTFDIVTTGSTTVPVADTALVSGTTPSGNTFVAAPAVNGSGNEVLRLTVVAAPEPSSLGLLAVGGAGLVARRRRPGGALGPRG